MSVIIRDACISDAPRLLEIYSYYVQHTAISFEYTTPTQEEFCRRMRHIMSRYPYLVAEVDGTVQGYAYAGAFVGRAAYDWSCELTIYLARDARKMGLGRQLYTALEQRLAQMGVLNLTPASAGRRRRTSISPATAPSSMSIWASRWPGPSAAAAISSAAGTTWSGWRSSLRPTGPSSQPLFPIRTCPTAKTCEGEK